MPQIEVTFDIDANGILNVSARDKDTGAEQRITISESSNLDQAEVDRMIADAERHRGEDRGCASWSTPATSWTPPPTRWSAGWRELRRRASPCTRRPGPRCWSPTPAQAVKEEAPLDRLRALTGELQQVYHGLRPRPRRRPGPHGRRAAAAPAGARADGSGADDDVIDAEFTTEE